jgi:hypothetical protein
MNNPSYIIDNRIDNLKDNRIDNKIDNNNSKNLGFVGELNEVATITSTNATNVVEDNLSDLIGELEESNTNTSTNIEDNQKDLVSVFSKKELDEIHNYNNLDEEQDVELTQEAKDELDRLLNGYTEIEKNKFEEYQGNKITSTNSTNENWGNAMEDNDDYGDTIEM